MRCNCGLCFVLLLFSGHFTYAKGPLEFDVPSTLAVEEVRDYPGTPVGEKLIAIRLSVSTFIAQPSTHQANELMITLELPSREFQVVDFLPKTTMDTRYAAPLIEKNSESQQLGLNFSAADLCKSLLGTTLGASVGLGETRATETQLKPPMEVATVAGTLQRGRGVYFKLRPAHGITLEGAHEMMVVATVPQSWRGDVARVRCQATSDASEEWFGSDSARTLAHRDFLVGLYLSSDAQAQSIADQFSLAEWQLRRTAQQHSAKSAKQPATLLKTMSGSQSKPAKSWLELCLYGEGGEQALKHVPAGMRGTAARYAASRDALHALRK